MTFLKIATPFLAMMLLIPVGMTDVMAQEVPGLEELEATKVGPVGTASEVNDRTWANTTEQIEAHRNFVAFVEHEMQDNYFNNEQKEASIIAYNI